MSLSLSRPTTDCGFAVDLLNFFLGALIVQLMKINWLLGIVGAGFSYSLIILRSYLESLPEANGYAEPPDQHQVVIPVGILQLQSNASSISASVVIQQEDNTQDQEIIQDNAGINLFMPQLLAAIKALEEKNLLLIRLLPRTPGESLQPDDNLFIDNLPSDIINNLHEAMKPAVAAGFEEECCHLYSSCRKDFLRQCLSALNLEILIDNDYENVGMTTERISSWLRASEIVVHFVFPNERRLCDRVFSGLWLFGDQSFMQICKEPAIRLLNFPRTFVAEISWPMIWGEVLEVLRTLQGIIPQLESLFHDQEVVTLSNEATTTCKRLAEAIRDVFKDMEYLIHSDMKNADVPGGIFPIAHDVVKCLRGVNKVRPMIERVWEEYHMVSNTGGTSPSFLDQVARILALLDSHLEARSKNYKEPALCYVSMMNNALYINEVSNNFCSYSPAFKKLPSGVQQNLENYLSSWNELLGLLKIDNKGKSVTSGVGAGSMEENLQLFNIQFELISSIQSKWFASDNIRKEIISTLENMLLPAYRNFIGRFQDVLRERADQCIQFRKSEIKVRLSNMFLGGSPTSVGMETERWLIEPEPDAIGKVSSPEMQERPIELVSKPSRHRPEEKRKELQLLLLENEEDEMTLLLALWKRGGYRRLAELLRRHGDAEDVLLVLARTKRVRRAEEAARRERAEAAARTRKREEGAAARTKKWRR